MPRPLSSGPSRGDGLCQIFRRILFFLRSREDACHFQDAGDGCNPNENWHGMLLSHAMFCRT